METKQVKTSFPIERGLLKDFSIICKDRCFSRDALINSLVESVMDSTIELMIPPQSDMDKTEFRFRRAINHYIMETVNIRLEGKGFKDKLDDFCEKQNVTISQLYTETMERFVDHQPIVWNHIKGYWEFEK